MMDEMLAAGFLPVGQLCHRPTVGRAALIPRSMHRSIRDYVPLISFATKPAMHQSGEGYIGAMMVS